jgi:hypothetical protein
LFSNLWERDEEIDEKLPPSQILLSTQLPPPINYAEVSEPE